MDLDAATRAGITVVNAPTGNTIAAAEHTLALLYGVARRIAAADASDPARRVEAGPVHRPRAARPDARHRRPGQDRPGHRAAGAGDGDDGHRRRSVRLRASRPPTTAWSSSTSTTLLGRADVITVHVPLTKATKGLIGRDSIARMKPGAIVLNVARGGILDEAAVADALRSGQLGGAGIDVFVDEPPTGSPLLEAPNTLLTPHLGASTAEAQVLVSEEVAAQILDVLDGRSARYAVNAPLLTPETAKAIAPYLPLAETLGRFFAQFSRGGIKTLHLEIAGDLAEFDGAPLTAAVLRGLLETSITERVNLVNAMALAKARGITVVERRTPDAGAFAAQLTLSSETPDGPAAVAGTVAGGEARLTRLDDYRLDMAPSRRDAHHAPHGPARHGRADRAHPRRGRREHQRDAARPVAAARGRPDDPGARRRGPGQRGRTRSARTRRSWTCGRSNSGSRPLSEPGSPIPDGLDGALVLVRHGQSQLIEEGPLPGPDGLAADGHRSRPGRARSPNRLAGRRVPPALPVPADAPSEIVHSPLARTAATARGDRRAPSAASETGGADVPVRGDPGFLEIGQGEWEGLTGAEIAERFGDTLAAWRRRPWETVAPGGETLGRGRGARRTGPRDRPDRAARRTRGRHAGPIARGRLRRCRAGPPVGDPRRARRRVQGRPADPVRPAARALLDVVDGPVRHHGRGVPRRPARSCARTTSRTTWRSCMPPGSPDPTPASFRPEGAL